MNNLENSPKIKLSRLAKTLLLTGIIITLTGLIMTFFAGEARPVIMISGILIAATGTTLSVIAVFSQWWKNG